MIFGRGRRRFRIQLQNRSPWSHPRGPLHRDFDPADPAYEAHLDQQGRITAGALFGRCFVPYETAIFGRNATSRDKWGKDLGKLIKDGAAPFMREDGRDTTLYTFTKTILPR